MSKFFGWVRDLLAAIGFLTLAGAIFWSTLADDGLKATLKGDTGQPSDYQQPSHVLPVDVVQEPSDYFETQEAKLKRAVEAHDLQEACSLASITAQRARDAASKSVYRDWVCRSGTLPVGQASKMP